MWYIPFLRAWRAFATYSIIVLSVAIVSSAVRFSPGVQISLDQIPKGPVDLTWIAIGGIVLIEVLATVMALSLASENEGHLEVSWTKPASRERYALEIFGIDFIAMAAAYILTVVVAVAVCDIWFGRQAVFAMRPLWVDAVIFVQPIYVYAIVAAGSASMKRSRGAVAGLFWPVTIGLGGLSAIQIDIVHKIADAINTINPLALFASQNGNTAPLFNYLIALVMTGVFLTLAILQWKRLEA